MEQPDNCLSVSGDGRAGKSLILTASFLICLQLFMADAIVACAADKEEKEVLSAGIATILNPSNYNTENPFSTIKEQENLGIEEKFAKEKERIYSEFAMANVQQALNIRAEANEESEKVGRLYKDCGGTILAQEDGWTKIKSGDVVGWAKDEYLYFGSEAQAVAEDVGNWIVNIEAESIRMREDPSLEGEIIRLLPQDEDLEIIEVTNDDWICVELEDTVGYVSTDYVNVMYYIDTAESMEVIRAREREEAERKRTANRGVVPASADELQLLAALIYCEAGNQSYEGKLGVGAVVMNRVRSGAYPNTIHSVIYASGQFTPAMSGKVARIYERGSIQAECIQAAQAAINGETTVGGATHFRRAGNREGQIIGAHVFW